MTKNTLSLALFAALACLNGNAFGQSVSSNIVGVVADPADAVVPGAVVELRETSTGLVRSFPTGTEGIFRFNELPKGTYNLTLKASGFKTYLQQGIELAASETRDLGRIKLTLGLVTEQVSVEAVATPLQTASSEKSSLVDGNQLNKIALKGRDLMGMLNLIPVVYSPSAGETTTESSIGNVQINGAGSARTNFTVDGIVDLDTGSNQTTHFEPNIDSIAEIRVLTTNFQAEYGRNASGTISVITKGGGQEFHGSAWATKRLARMLHPVLMWARPKREWEYCG